VNPSSSTSVQVIVELPGGSMAWRVVNATQLAHPVDDTP